MLAAIIYEWHRIKVFFFLFSLLVSIFQIFCNKHMLLLSKTFVKLAVAGQVKWLEQGHRIPLMFKSPLQYSLRSVPLQRGGNLLFHQMAHSIIKQLWLRESYFYMIDLRVLFLYPLEASLCLCSWFYSLFSEFTKCLLSC